MTNHTPTPSVFSFDQFPVRAFADESGEPWFLANDVCKVLGYRNSWDAVAKHCRTPGVAKREVGVTTGKTADGSDAKQQVEMTFINEGNLYRLIIKSRKPEAERFEQLVMDEILPTIRKTGRYAATRYENALTGQPVVRSGAAFVPVGQAESDKYLLLNAMIQQMGFGHPPVVLPSLMVQSLFSKVRAYQADVYMAAEWLSFIDKEIAAIKTATGRDFGENPNAAKPWPQAEDDEWEA